MLELYPVCSILGLDPDHLIKVQAREEMLSHLRALLDVETLPTTAQ